jgi:hypothetical protein
MAAPILRGSQYKFTAIKEVTFGTTPATPTFIEYPLASFNQKTSQTVLRSNQIRSHPYTDKMLFGRTIHELGGDFEMQAATHDALIETHFGAAISAKALVYADALKSFTAEVQQSSGARYNSYTGFFIDKLSISASANDTSPVKCTFSGMAKAGTLDATATISSAITAAGNPDPYVFADATLKIATVDTAVMSGNIDFSRQVDPLMLWGSRTPREYIPGAVTASGKITVPYDDGVQSALVTAFADNALVFKFANVGVTTFRQFTFPKAKIFSRSAPVQGRGGIFQEIDWEAYYDSSTTTICTMATE